MVSTLIFLLLNRLYPVLFDNHIGRVARYTSSMIVKNISAKLRFFRQSEFIEPTLNNE